MSIVLLPGQPVLLLLLQLLSDTCTHLRRADTGQEAAAAVVPARVVEGHQVGPTGHPAVRGGEGDPKGQQMAPNMAQLSTSHAQVLEVVPNMGR